MLKLFCLLWMGVFFVACSDEPAGQTEPVAEQPGQEAVAKDVAVRTDPVEAEEPQAEPVAEAQAVTEMSQEAEAVESEAQAAAVQAESEDGESEEAEPEQEEPARGLTDVSATVVREADVRIRPGLAWQVTDRLESGAAAVAPHQAGGWVRIRYGDGLKGWIRVTALDLGKVEESQILEQAAPPLIAEWRGEEYGVMGQSADGAEVRLLQVADERPTVVGAPIKEVRLIDAVVTLEELPILIADETVVFPGDDFRVGQGKILPRANEWMWLPWGWLLAHNDTHIWQWRPETDELELIERPPGFARLSPDGRYLAIANLCPRDLNCSRDNDVVLIPLDGSPRTTFSEVLGDFEVAPSLGTTTNKWISNLGWSGNSRAVKLLAPLFDGAREPSFPTTLVFHVDGHVARFEEFWQADLQGEACHAEITLPGPSFVGGWEFHDLDTIASRAECVDADGNREFRTTVFTLTGDFVRFDPPWTLLTTDEEVIRLRSAEGSDAIGEHPYIQWSPSRRYAIVKELRTGRVWLYGARRHHIRSVVVRSERSPTGTYTWPHFDPDEDRRSWQCCDVYWFKDKRAAVVSLWHGQPYSVIQSAMALNLSTAEALELDLGNARVSVRPTGSWDPRGESFQIMLGETGRSEVRDEGLNLSPLLIFGQDGGLRGALFTTTGCRQLDASGQVPRYRADWSPDGQSFAVGGHEPHGLYVCPSGE